jgi:hypothetical protein
MFDMNEHLSTDPMAPEIFVLPVDLYGDSVGLPRWYYQWLLSSRAQAIDRLLPLGIEIEKLKEIIRKIHVDTLLVTE